MKLGLLFALSVVTGAASTAAVVACNACCHAPGAVAPSTLPDAGPELDTCFEACAILADAGCPAGLSSKCVPVCLADAVLGPASQLTTSCVLEAGPRREALEACGACPSGDEPP